MELARQVGEADGVIVFDPSAFAKKGTESRGNGAVGNCQVGIYLGYVERLEHALVNL